MQGTTYYYRVMAQSAGGTGYSTSTTFSLEILSGFARQFPTAPASATGSLQVNLAPSGITPSPGWNFVGEQLWRASGSTAVGLTTGNYQIEYQTAPGYIQPAPETISVTSGGSTTVVNRVYYPTPGGTLGGLTVVLAPSNLTTAQWNFYGQSQLYYSGTTVPSLSPGNYLIQCQPVSGQTTPAVSSVTVSGGTTTLVNLTYTATTTPIGAQPALLPFSTVINPATPSLPYAFVGQIRSNVGSASGCVVQDRVVATAGHVVFDDGSLNYVTGLQWIFERSEGTYDPVPQTPQGFYVFDGYAAHRIAEGTPGVSSPASQNLDVAALYFLASAGGGGYSGYLASDAVTNEFLIPPQPSQPNSAILVGYPVDGITAANQGQMYATPAVNAVFSQVPGSDSSGNPYRVYTTSSLTSVGGNSGGPLCIQYTDGNYYPAAIYLGGSAQTVVRSIDSAVVDLFNRAQVSGDGGANNTGGGIVQVNTPLSGSALTTASLTVNIAGSSTATWALGVGSAYAQHASGFTLPYQPAYAGNSYELYLPTISGFLPPPQPYYSFSLVGGAQNTITYTYEGITAQPQNASASVGGSATFSVGVSQNATNPATYQWMRNGVNIQGATSATYTRSNVSSSDNGSSYSVLVTWGGDGSQPSTPATLTVTGSGTTFSSWATQEGLFGNNALPTAIISHDRLNNLYKYALGLNPFTLYNPGNASLPVVQLANVSGTEYLTLSFDGVATDVTYKVQATSDFNAGWTTIKTYSSGGSAPGAVTVQDTQPVTASSVVTCAYT